MRKKITAIIMCVLMMVTLLPVSVVADEATATNKVYLGASCLKKGEELNFGRYNHEEDNGVLQGESWDFHYTNPYSWIILDTDAESQRALLLSKKTFSPIQFSSEPAYYSASSLQNDLNRLFNGEQVFDFCKMILSDKEKTAVVPVTIESNDTDSNSPTVTNARLFPMSYSEAESLGWGSDILKPKPLAIGRDLNGDTVYWWLRSTGANGINTAYMVTNEGQPLSAPVAAQADIRPECYLDLSEIAFVTYKATEAGCAYITYYDAGRDTFTASYTSSSSVVQRGNAVSFSYSGATTGVRQRLTVMLVDESDNVVYFDDSTLLSDTTNASGTYTLTVPATLDEGTYKLKVSSSGIDKDSFDENDNCSHYTSQLRDVETLSVKSSPEITTESLPGGMVRLEYSQTVAATGSAPLTWSVSSGALPNGLSLNGATGKISGTPTTAGDYTFRILASNGYLPNSEKEYTITIAPAIIPVTNIFMTSPGTVQAGSNLTLLGTVKPDEATNKTIVWSVEDAGVTGATVTNGVFSATSAGTAVVKATIKDGIWVNSDYEKTFNITVTENPYSPKNLAWDSTVGGKATWGAVENVSDYSVQLYKDGEAAGKAVYVAGALSYDFTSAITVAGSYTFKVTSCDNGDTYPNGESAESPAYNYVPPTLTGISVTVQPTLAYITGSTLDLSDMVIKASYEDGSEKLLSYNSIGVTVSVSNGTVLTRESYNGQPITVTFSGLSVPTANMDIRILGDLTNDGAVDNSDYQAAVNIALAEKQATFIYSVTDIDRDGSVDAIDLHLLERLING